MLIVAGGNSYNLGGSLVSSSSTTQPVFNLVFSSQSPLVQAIQSVPVQCNPFTQQQQQQQQQPQNPLITPLQQTVQPQPQQQPQQNQPKTVIIDNSQALQRLLEGLSGGTQTFTIQQQQQQPQQIQQQQQQIIQQQPQIQQQQQPQQQRSGPRPLQPVKPSSSSTRPRTRRQQHTSSSNNLELGQTTTVYQTPPHRSSSTSQIPDNENRRMSTGSIKNVRFSTDGPFVVPANPVPAQAQAPAPKARQVRQRKSFKLYKKASSGKE